MTVTDPRPFTIHPEETTDDAHKAFSAYFTGANSIASAGSPEDIADRNALRASYALIGVTAYAARVGGRNTEPFEQQIRDLLSDLMHLVDLFKGDADEGTAFDLDTLLDNARRRYEEEVNGE